MAFLIFRAFKSFLMFLSYTPLFSFLAISLHYFQLLPYFSYDAMLHLRCPRTHVSSLFQRPLSILTKQSYFLETHGCCFSKYYKFTLFKTMIYSYLPSLSLKFIASNNLFHSYHTLHSSSIHCEALETCIRI